MKVLRWVWRNLATLSILAMVVVLVFTAMKVVSLSREGKQAHDAICTLKGDLSQRIDQGREFLAKHPKGAFGIPATTIKTSIDNQQRTLDALQPVKCSANERNP